MATGNFLIESNMKIVRWLGEIWDAFEFIILHSFAPTLPFFGLTTIAVSHFIAAHPNQPGWVWGLYTLFRIITTILVLLVVKAYIQDKIHNRQNKRNIST